MEIPTIENNINEISDKRVELIKEIQKLKYASIEITENDKKANEFFYSKVKPNFKFNDDFYFDLVMKYKADIEKNQFFDDLKHMPKGCLLHHHIVDCIDVKWISEEVMKEKNLKHIYMRNFRTYEILVYTTKPDEKEPNCDRPFKNIIQKYLEENSGKTVYDYFHERCSMLPNEFDNVKNNDEAFSLFMPKYFFCYYLIFYKPFYRQHIRNTFIQCLEDKQFRLESRLTPGRIRDETYKVISKDEEFAIYKEEVEYINNNYNLNTKFTFGAIVEMMRNKTDEYIKKTIEDSIELRRKYPDLICGIDLSGDENNFRTFQDLTPVMLNNTDPELPWILHCGESIKALNYNLVDGFLNNAKRFGHVINLFKLGNLWEIFKSKDIIFEINPISNQTLRQVRDLRLHPCIGYHNNGIKICINNDDPTIYNTKGVGYDYFAAAAAMEFDLVDLKCFGLYSIDGAQIPEELKKEYKLKYLDYWNEFIDYFIKKYEN
jgi:adenosine deaminase CECR1